LLGGCNAQDREVEEACTALQQVSGALAADRDSVRVDALEVALGKARAILAALQRPHASGHLL
jgi:hypothetical protein